MIDHYELFTSTPACVPVNTQLVFRDNLGKNACTFAWTFLRIFEFFPNEFYGILDSVKFIECYL